MSDPITVGLASTAVSLVNGTISLFKQVNDAAKESDNIDLKRGLSDLYSQIVEIKAQVLDLAQENTDLRRQLTLRNEMSWDASKGVYFAENDPSPFCPACWDGNGKLVRLNPNYARGGSLVWKYDCKVCHNYFLVPD
jgi:hypothetical protein